MQTKALSPYIWKMPNEYRNFLKHSQFFKKFKYLHDLLHFEYSELFIFMQKEAKSNKKRFDISKKYKLASNITLHKYKYDVVNREFNSKIKIYLLGYFDTFTQEVSYRPLNKIFFLFLKSFDKKITLKKNLLLFLKKNKICYETYKKDFISVLEELFDTKVLISFKN